MSSAQSNIDSVAPPIVSNARTILSQRDVIFCDVWGVVHNGLDAFEDACAALAKFRTDGGSVILVSNAPVPKVRVAAMLDQRKVPRNSWDDIVCSGDLALDILKHNVAGPLYAIGPHERDQLLFKEVETRLASFDEASAILCSGLNDDRNERPEDYEPMLEKALQRDMPFVCANPDLVVDVGGTHYFCAGAIADIYEKMGGKVFWAGKPYPIAYEAALRRAETLRSETIDRSRTIVIGDAIRTDIKGAELFGCDAIFVAAGIHRDDATEDGELDRAKLEMLFIGDAPRAIAAMDELRW